MFLCPVGFLILAKSEDIDKKKQHDAAFHLGLHCLPKYQFRGFEYTKALSFPAIHDNCNLL